MTEAPSATAVDLQPAFVDFFSVSTEIKNFVQPKLVGADGCALASRWARGGKAIYCHKTPQPHAFTIRQISDANAPTEIQLLRPEPNCHARHRRCSAGLLDHSPTPGNENSSRKVRTPLLI
jgi:hypothetical protein